MSNFQSQLQTLNVGPGIIGIRPVGGNIPSTATPWEFNGLQNFSLDLDQKIVSAMGQGKMPFDTAPTDMTIKGTLSGLQLTGTGLANSIFGDAPTSGTIVTSYREAYTLASSAISAHAVSTLTTLGEFIAEGTYLYVCTTAGTTASTSPAFGTVIGGTTTDGTAIWTNVGLAAGITNLCVVIVAQAAKFADDGNVMYQNTNVQLANVSVPPALAQYSVPGNGVYIFNSADAANLVFITYDYTSSSMGSSFPIMQHTQGWGPICSINARFPYQSVNGQLGAGVLLEMVRFGKVSLKTKRDNYMTIDVDYEAFAPPSGVAGYLYLPN